MTCIRNPDGTVRVTAYFRPPAGTPTVDPFDVVVGSDPTQQLYPRVLPFSVLLALRFSRVRSPGPPR